MLILIILIAVAVVAVLFMIARNSMIRADMTVSMQGNNEISYAKGRELLCSVESEEEAKDIAAQYGIEFVEFSYGLAVFHTDEDPYEVIERGRKSGLKELSINGIGHMDKQD